MQTFWYRSWCESSGNLCALMFRTERKYLCRREKTNPKIGCSYSLLPSAAVIINMIRIKKEKFQDFWHQNGEYPFRKSNSVGVSCCQVIPCRYKISRSGHEG